ncbi:DISARM system phospholipase D-like protein DrmC [Streptomyces sp. NPDC059378]|uniref:DISARM system phospholipase D-like protein DrmC n=1 Tax=Streptomyces sp. NPDC059378 TaxID=3346815 RepID=UPI0036996B76
MTAPPAPASEPTPATGLPAVLARLAAELPPAHRQAWIRVLHTSPVPAPGVEARLLTAWPGGTRAELARALMHAWGSAVPTPDGPAVALALQAAAVAHTTAAEARRVDLVVSGPTTAAVPVRYTAQVIAEVIRAARRRLLVVSFAAYQIPEVVTELRAAADRGVQLDVVLESPREDGGVLRQDARTAFGTLAADFWHWPATRRPTEGGRASLHAKLIAADDHTAFLGSANLTGQALSHNLEVGVVLRNPEVVGRLVAHFRTLMNQEHGILRRL